MSLVETLLGAIVRLRGDALVMHVGEKPYVVTTSELTDPYRGPISWGQVELSSRSLTVEAVDGMVQQLLPDEQRQRLAEVGAVEFTLPPNATVSGRFTVIAARGGDDIWLEIRPLTPETEAARAGTAPSEGATAAPFAAPAEPAAEPPDETEVAPLQVDPAAAAVDAADSAPADRAEAASDAAPGPSIEGPEIVLVDQPPEPPSEDATHEEPGVEIDLDAGLEATAPASAAPTVEPDEHGQEHVYDLTAESWETYVTAVEPTLPAEAAEAAVETVAAEPEPAVEATVEAVAAEPEPAVEAAVEAVAAAPEPAAEAAVEAVAAESEPAAEAAVEAVAAEPEPAVEVAVEAVAAEPEPAVEVAVEAVAAAPEEAVGAAVEAVAAESEPAAEAAVEAVAAAPEPAVEAPVEAVAAEPEPAVGAPVEAVAAESEPAAEAPVEAAAVEPEMSVEEPAESVNAEPVMAAEMPGETVGAEPEAAVDVPQPDAHESEPVVVAETPTLPEPEAAGPGESEAALDTRAPARVVTMDRTVSVRASASEGSSAQQSMLDSFLRLAADRGATALYLVTGMRPAIRVDGEIQLLAGKEIPSASDVAAMLAALAPEPSRQALRTGAPTEWVCDVRDVGRIRCLSFRDHRGPGGIFRMLPARALSAEQLGLSRELQALCLEAEGLVLVTGPRASGKSTLLSAFVDLVNRTRADHVITFEGQIRFVHESRRSFVSQRELRGDAAEVAVAIRRSLREDPDVLMVEDFGSADIITVALEAAESGRLVFGAVPAASTTAAIDRIVDQFPPERRVKVQTALASTLRGVVAQVLLRKIGGGRVPAREVLLNTPDVAALIAESSTAQIGPALEAGRAHGMAPLNDTLVSLVRAGAVTPSEAFRKAANREGFLQLLRREGLDTSFVERLA